MRKPFQVAAKVSGTVLMSSKWQWSGPLTADMQFKQLDGITEYNCPVCGTRATFSA